VELGRLETVAQAAEMLPGHEAKFASWLLRVGKSLAESTL